MVKMQKILGILLALCFLLSVTAGAASACSCNDGHGKEKCGHHAEGKWNKDRHVKFGEFKKVEIYCFDNNNYNCNDEDNNVNCNDEDDDNNEDEC
jgi:hypothetical protein